MERVRESAVGHHGARLLLCDGLFHSGQRRCQHMRDTRDHSGDTQSENTQNTNTWRKVQARVFFAGHRLRGHIHDRVFPALVCGALTLRLRPLGDERDRCGRHISLLHIARDCHQ